MTIDEIKADKFTMTTDEIKAFVKQYIKQNLKIVFDQHWSDGYHDSNYFKVKISIEDEILYEDTINLPDDQ